MPTSSLRSSLAALSLASAVAAQTAIGSTRWSPDRTIEYVIGNAPLVLSGGHGGDLQPPAIPDRTYGTTVKDSRTLELTREFADELAQRFGLRPHLILCHLSRRKLDVNREIVEAAQGNPLAEAAYLAFHQAIAEARAAVLAQWGFGFYFDLHGHGHPEAWIELGYSLTATQLGLSDATLAQPSYVVQSTIRSAGSLPGVSFPALLRGPASLGGFLQSGGYPSVPSPAFPNPAGGNYFSGGYNVDNYGSMNGSAVDGVQVETPWSVRSSVLVRRPFLARTAQWVQQFFTSYRGVDPSSGGRVTLAATDRVASESGGRGEFVVTRTGSLALARFVPLAWSGTATPGVDLPLQPTFAFFPPGVPEVRLPIVALDDGVAEGDETIELRLASGSDIGVANHAGVVLVDDEAAADEELQLSFTTVAAGSSPDGSGNGRHATLLPAAAGPTAVAGPFGQALRCDGVDDRARVADFAYGGGAFSLAFWFRTTAVGGTGFRYLVSHGGVATPNRLGVYFDQATGVLRTGLIWANDLTELDVLDVTRDLRDGQWHHYALVARNDDLVQVCIDGVPETAAMHLGDVLNPAGDFVFGARSDLAAGTFAAVDLDEVRLWRRALSLAEVQLLQARLGAEAMVHPGSGEDLELATGVDAVPAAGPRFDVKRASAGSTLQVTYRSPAGGFDGGIAVLAGELFATGAPPQHPLLPYVHLAAPVFVQGPIVLGPAGGSWSIVVPAGLAGQSLMLQPVVLHPAVANGVFAIGDGHEIRF